MTYVPLQIKAVYVENKFSTRSLDRLKTCHEDIQLVMQEVIRVVDFSVVFGHRGEEEQNKAYPKFSSKLHLSRYSS